MRTLPPRWAHSALLLLAVLTVLLAGCNLSATSSGGATATPRATSLATETATARATATPSDLDARINAYIAGLSQTQQIGELLMLAVYTNAYSSALDVPLHQADISNVLIFNAHNGGPLMPTTLDGMRQLVSALLAHASSPLLVATDEEGGGVDRLAPYYGASPAPAALTATGDPQQAYNQAKLDAQRLLDVGINADFAPLADVSQGGAIDASRMFGTTVDQVTQFAGAFLDGLQQNGVVGTLKHWPGIGAVPANPDYALPTLSHTQAQLNAIDFATFRALLPRNPGMIMVTHVLVPAYDSSAPASLSPKLVDGVLRGQLGYDGVVVTDEMEATSITQYMQTQGYSNAAQGVGEASVRAILAGDDLIECPVAVDQEQAIVAAVTQAVQSGRISQARLHQSLVRIIRLKVRMGLLTLPPA